MKNLPPLPNSGGAFTHDAASNTLTRTETAADTVTGGGSGKAEQPVPASAYPSGSRRLATPVSTPAPRGKSRR